MLHLTIPKKEFWDENQEVFIIMKEQNLTLEHSLLSISKWETKWHTPFISDKEKTKEETLDYIKCMTVNSNVEPNVYRRLTSANLKTIEEYIGNSATATWFTESKNGNPNRQKKEQITSELVYYWMTANQIPFECEKWHFNRLMVLIRICGIKNNSDPKKQGKRDVMKNNAAMNAARRGRIGSKG